MRIGIWKKLLYKILECIYNASLAVSPVITIPNNSATIVAAKKEEELNENTFDNPTYSEVKKINI